MTTEHPLIGRAFHTQHDDLKTEWQGKIIADCGDGYFLAQLYEWFTGGPSTAHIFHISVFAAQHENGALKFRFFENMKDADSYMKNVANARDQYLMDREQAA